MNLCVRESKESRDGKVVYFEEIKRELQRILLYVCRCNERLNAKSEGSIRLGYTGKWVTRGTGTPKDKDDVTKRRC